MDRVTQVKVLPPYTLEVTFDDGLVRRVNVESVLWGEVFEPLRDPARFAEVEIDSLFGTVMWPNGADLATEFLRTCAGEDVRGPSAA